MKVNDLMDIVVFIENVGIKFELEVGGRKTDIEREGG